MSTEDIFGGAFAAGASRERKPSVAEVEAARGEFGRVVEEVIKPVFLEMGKEIAARGDSYEVGGFDERESPSIFFVVRIKGEEYGGKVEPPRLTYEFDPQSLKIRLGGWITIPSKRNYAKVLAVALIDSVSISKEAVRRRILSFLEEIHELTVAKDSFIHSPLRRNL